MVPDFAKFIIGPAKGPTWWLNPGLQILNPSYRLQVHKP